jgi:DNA mismatch repair protein MutS
VIDRARLKLANLENDAYRQQQNDKGSTQLDLFAMNETHPAVSALGEVDPDDLTPREALNLLYHLKTLL